MKCSEIYNEMFWECVEEKKKWFLDGGISPYTEKSTMELKIDAIMEYLDQPKEK